MICEIRQNGVVLRNPTLWDRLAVLFLPKSKEIVFGNPEADTDHEEKDECG